MSCSTTSSRAEVIATFLRICRNASRIEVLRAILLRWPDITLDELYDAIAKAQMTADPDKPMRAWRNWQTRWI